MCSSSTAIALLVSKSNSPGQRGGEQLPGTVHVSAISSRRIHVLGRRHRKERGTRTIDANFYQHLVRRASTHGCKTKCLAVKNPGKVSLRVFEQGSCRLSV